MASDKAISDSSHGQRYRAYDLNSVLSLFDRGKELKNLLYTDLYYNLRLVELKLQRYAEWNVVNKFFPKSGQHKCTFNSWLTCSILNSGLLPWAVFQNGWLGI